MTAMTISEFSTSDVPVARTTGTGKRRKIVHLRGIATAAHTLNLYSTDDTIIDVEGVMSENYGGVATSTALTWSTSTITVKGTGAYEATLMVTLV